MRPLVRHLVETGAYSGLFRNFYGMKGLRECHPTYNSGIATSYHYIGFDSVTSGKAKTSARSSTLIKSQCNPNFDSVLDFVFANAAARLLLLTSVILQEANDCGNGAANPDHRPLRAEFELGAVAPARTRAELLLRIEAIEPQIQELRTLIERLPYRHRAFRTEIQEVFYA